MTAQVVTRPEIVRDNAHGIVGTPQPLSAFETVYRIGWLRKLALLLILVLVWETYARWLGKPTLFPTFSAALAAFFCGIASGALLIHAAASLQTLLTGYVIGVVLAVLLTTLAINTKWGTDLLETLAAIFNPLPAIALLPLTSIWFGPGKYSVIFVVVHSVLWSVAPSMCGGLRAVSPTLLRVGRNYGLNGISLTRSVLIPAAFPSILKSLKIGWASSWRTLMAAELALGASAGIGGLGRYLIHNRNQQETADVFAGLLLMIVIGLFVENLIFAAAERRTALRWGCTQMKSAPFVSAKSAPMAGCRLNSYTLKQD